MALRPFRHTLLDDPSTQIRLLEVDEPVNSKSPIACRLTSWSVDAAPPYFAISYTWGPETPVEPIRVNGDLMIVRKNCADVLHELLYFKAAKYYWIDAICIAQNVVNEKNHQVAIMGSTFQRAQHVLLCIGDYDDDGEYSITTIVERLQERPDAVDSPIAGTTNLKPIILNDTDFPSDVDIPRFIKSLSMVIRRPYFKRVWVVQELILAREASICCGRFRLSLPRLRAEVDAMEYAILKARHEPLGESRSPLTKILKTEQAANDETIRTLEDDFNHNCGYVLANQNRMAHSGQKMSLAVLIRLFTSYECEDPRDTLYAALALTDWGQQTPIEPDYNKSKFELAVEVLTMYSASAVSFDLLYNLKIDFDSPEIQVGRRSRRIPLEQTEQTLAGIPFPTSHNKIEVTMLGQELTEADWTWETCVYHHDTESVELSSRSRGDLPSAQHLEAPAGTRPGDWLLPALDGTPFARSEHQRHAVVEFIIVRQAGPVYAIVGRAVKRDTDVNWWTVSNTFFKVWFDPADFLVLAATIVQLSDRLLFRTNICSAPFSSFATISGRKLEADRSSGSTESYFKYRRRGIKKSNREGCVGQTDVQVSAAEQVDGDTHRGPAPDQSLS